MRVRSTLGRRAGEMQQLVAERDAFREVGAERPAPVFCGAA
jgi:hypothetical protein